MLPGVSVLLLAVGVAGSPSAPDVAGRPTAADLREHGIVLVAGDDPAQPYVQQIYEGFRDALASASTRTLLFREFFDAVRFGDRAEYAGEFRTWLFQKYRDRRVDVLVTTQQTTLELFTGPNDGRWSEVPIVYGTLGPLPAAVVSAHPAASGVILENDFPQFLQLITAVLPATRQIAMIRGASAAERTRDEPYVAEIARQGLALQDLGGMTMDAILEHVGMLGVDTVPILVGFQVDSAGRTFQSDQAVKLIARAANRPVFSINPADIGGGATGGLLFGTHLLGEQLAAAALLRLAGGAPQTITIPAQRHARAVFDGRELRRWNIAEARLPQGSTMLFREPSLWRDYRR